jgi:O-antigen/teichoic acid export membrane protein
MGSEITPTTKVKTEEIPLQGDIAVLATGASITLVGKVGGRAIDAITDVVLARFLGPASFGLYSIGITLLRIAGTIGMLGLQNGVIRFGSKYKNSSPEDFKSTLVISLGLSVTSGALLGILLFSIAPWLASRVYAKPDLTQVFYGFAIGFPLAIGLWVASAATRISKNMKYSVISEDVAQPIVNLVLLIIISFSGLTLIGAIVSNVVSFGVGLGFGLFFVAKLFSGVFSRPLGREVTVNEILKFSVPTGFAGTFTLLTDWTGRLFVGIFRSASETGIYQTASQISLIFVVILTAMNTIFSPMIADLFNNNEIIRMEELYRVSTKWGLYLIAPLYLVIMIFPEEFISSIFGESFVSGYLPMMILASTQVINVGTGAVGYLLIMTGHQNNWFITSGITMVLCIILNAILVPQFGMLGGAVATAIAISSLYIAGLAQVRIILKLWPYDHRYVKGIVALGISAGVLLLINWMLNLSPIPLILLSVSIAYLVFGLMLLSLGLNNEDREFVQLIIARLKLIAK